MFSRDTKSAGRNAGPRVPSIISTNLRIVGDLVSEGDVQVDGVIEGDVHARSLTVSEGAAVRGEIKAESVCIRGAVEGQITADQVQLGRTAKVVGDVVHAVLAIESGAFIEGHCRHKPEKVEAVAVTDEEGAESQGPIAASA
ncbi:MAG: polymer-forming cytoskeletal protein [Alphaproteobacteria bacterium]|nr:polymer-forming cytoskeletal protein [Alphaproteobacteria bacterium]